MALAISIRLDDAPVEPTSLQNEPATELRDSVAGPLLDPDALQTVSRRQFSSCPGTLLRCPHPGLQSPIFLTSAQPMRPVDARWQLVIQQVHRRLPATAFESDPWIGRAHRYLQALLDCQSNIEREVLGRRVPEVHTAFNIYRGPDKFVRGRLEAFLLTDRPYKEIALRCGLSLLAVECYERLFFCIRERAKHWLAAPHLCFDGKFWDGMVEGDVDVILRRAGLGHNGAMLDLFLDYYSSDGWRLPERFNAVTRDLLVEQYDRLLVRTLVVSWLLPPSKIQRAAFLGSLVAELKALIDAWPEGAPVPTHPPFGPPTPRDQLAAWWATLQRAISLAARRVA